MEHFKEHPNGTLTCDTEYASWVVGDETITLDGRFTPAELRYIADWMDAHTVRETVTP